MYLVTEESCHLPDSVRDHVTLLLTVSLIVMIMMMPVMMMTGKEENDDLDPSQSVVSTDSWSDASEKEKSVHLGQTQKQS